MLVGFVIRQQPLSVLPHRLKASMVGREPCTGSHTGLSLSALLAESIEPVPIEQIVVSPLPGTV